MAESKLRELSTDFAVQIIKLSETIKGHYREMVVDLYNQCDTIRRILIASINTAKENV